MSNAVSAAFNVKFQQFLSQAQAKGNFLGMSTEDALNNAQVMRLFAKILIYENMSPMPVPSSQPSEDPTSTRGKAFKAVTVSGKRFTQKDRVLAWLKANPGAAREDVSDGLDMRHSAVTARVKELIDDAKVVAMGTKMGSAGIEVERLYVLDNILGR